MMDYDSFIENAKVKELSRIADALERIADSLDEKNKPETVTMDPADENQLLIKAAELGVERGFMSYSILMRGLHLGYGRSAWAIDKLIEVGVVGEKSEKMHHQMLITDPERIEYLVRSRKLD